MKKVSVGFALAQIILLVACWRRLPPQLPLFYSRPWGEEQLTTPFGLLLLPTLSLLIGAINVFLPLLLPYRQKLISQILGGTSAIFSLLCLITLTKIILLVI